ncbi:MAG: hypothetical protein EXS63_04815 [Candidatus Omnitrophica bacterium]|nr:hypothetical protein [Candidatus Omnitrophota bacterium]
MESSVGRNKNNPSAEGLGRQYVIALMPDTKYKSFGPLKELTAGKTKTSTVTTQTTAGTPVSDSTNTVTPEKEVVTDAHPRGIIGDIFYTAGKILIFPFKVIGSLFS